MPDEIEALIAEARDPKWRPHLTEPAGDVWVRLADALSAARAVIVEAKAVHAPVTMQVHVTDEDRWPAYKLVERLFCSTCKEPRAGDARRPWPCPTAIALSKFPSGEEDGR